MGGDVLPEKGLLQKAATIKSFEYSPFGCKLKRQTDIVEKQYQGLNKVYEFNKKKGDETINKEEKDDKSNLIYNSNHSF